MSNYIYVTDTTSCHIGLELFKNRISWFSLVLPVAWEVLILLTWSEKKKKICTILTVSAGRLVTSWFLKHPSPSLKKEGKNLPRSGESCQIEFPFISMSVAQLAQCLSELCGSNSAIFSSISLISLYNILKYILQVWGLFCLFVSIRNIL